MKKKITRHMLSKLLKDYAKSHKICMERVSSEHLDNLIRIEKELWELITR